MYYSIIYIKLNSFNFENFSFITVFQRLESRVRPVASSGILWRYMTFKNFIVYETLLLSSWGTSIYGITKFCCFKKTSFFLLTQARVSFSISMSCTKHFREQLYSNIFASVPLYTFGSCWKN